MPPGGSHRPTAKTMQERSKMLAPLDQSIPDSDERTVAVFDVRIPGVAERLHSERAAYREHGDIEALDHNHYVLIVRPGAARGLSR